MTTKIHPAPALGGNYDLRRLDSAQLGGAEAHVGLVRLGRVLEVRPRDCGPVPDMRLRTSSRAQYASIRPPAAER